MRRAVSVAVMAAVCAMTLGACSHDEPAGPRTPLTSGPADPPSSSATSPSTTPPSNGAPTMPALAKKETTAGAKAFVRYYIEVLNDATRTQMTARLAAKSASDCRVCHNIISSIRRAQAHHGYQKGGIWHPVTVYLAPGGTHTSPQLLAEIQVSPGVWRAYARSKLHRIKAQKVHDQFRLTWLAPGGWLVKDITES